MSMTREIAEHAISFRQSVGFRYPDNAAFLVAEAMDEALAKGLGNHAMCDAAEQAMTAIERPFYSNPEWDGSIG